MKIVLPSWCVVCHQPLEINDRVASCCSSCWSGLERASGSTCRRCSIHLPLEGEDLTCLACATDPIELEWIEAWGPYRGNLERVIHAFKFEKHDFLDKPLAALLCQALDARCDRSFDVVVPVPMHPRKVRARGFNQSELLARNLARITSLKYADDLLSKVKDNASQSTLPRDERGPNVRRAFKAAGEVKGRSILLVDDICTTGETLRACTRALLRAGAGRVCAVTIARA